MERTMKRRFGIETNYNGTIFRSRLEARWAAFWDLLHWEWEYEPIDLDGYIPDFVLKFYKPLLVEVKPEMDIVSLHQYTAKIENSGWAGEYLVVGATLFNWDDDPFWQYPGIGLLAERYAVSNELEFSRNGMVDSWLSLGKLFCCGLCGEYSVFHSEGWYGCRVGGCYDGDGHLSPAKNIKHLWKQAGNEVRWQKYK